MSWRFSFNSYSNKYVSMEFQQKCLHFEALIIYIERYDCIEKVFYKKSSYKHDREFKLTKAFVGADLIVFSRKNDEV